jgi:FixJ family two-component response regulator
MSVRAMKRGAVDFLPKPFRDQDMLGAVMAAGGGLPVKVLADAIMVRNTDPTGTAG